jgi:hypothetical protein
MGCFFYRLRVGSLRFARFEQKTATTGSAWAAMAMSLAGFLCRCDLLIRPKKEKDHVDPSSLPAPGNNHAAMHTSWCRSGVSACGLLALVYHPTTPETSQGTERCPSSVVALYLSGSLSGRLSVRSTVVRASESGLTSITAGLMGYSHLFEPVFIP